MKPAAALPVRARTRQALLLSSLALGVGGLLGAGEARAQETGFALDRFEPSERGSDWFWGESLDLRGNGRVAVGLVGDWAYKPLVGDNGQGITSIVRNQLYGHFGVAVNVVDRLRFGLDFPVLFYGDGTPVQLGAVRYETDEGATIGDLRLGADVRLVGEYGGPAVLAVGTQVFLPTGSRDAYTGDEKVRVAPRISVAGDIEQLAYSARVGLMVHALREDFATMAYGTDLQAGATVGVRLLDERLLIGPEVLASTVISDSGDGFFKDDATPVEGLIGGHFTQDGWRFGLGIGTALNDAFGSPKSRVLASIEWVAPSEPPPPADADADGVADPADACPSSAGLPNADPRLNGCPPPQDSDGDGIADGVDACARLPGPTSPEPAKNGCPLDSDADAILDQDDACPSQPGVANADRSKNGCPSDGDGDGVADAVDACPNAAGVQSEDPARNGCPPDKDGDTILDAQDACPESAGPPDPDAAKNGCPRVQVTKEQVVILDRIEFDNAAATLRETSGPLLQQIADVLAKNPQIQLLRIEGHSDDRGARPYNLQLSKARAQAVLKRLSELGVDGQRLVAEGVGPDRPIVANDSEEGRQTNRRVEFHIVQADATPAPTTSSATPAPSGPAPSATPAEPPGQNP
jgi:OmpA-OmpF porin, OOP family